MTDPFPMIEAAEGWSPDSDQLSARFPTGSFGVGQFNGGPQLADYWGGQQRSSEQQALALSAFFSGISLISEAMGVMPLKVYKERKSGSGWDWQDQHPTNYCLTKTNNGWQTPSSFKSEMQSHLLMSGNAVAAITRNGRGQGVELKSYLPVNTRFYLQPGGMPKYALSDNPWADEDNLLMTTGPMNVKFFDFDFDEVIHIKAFGLNGYLGRSVLKMARSSINLSTTVEQFGQKFFDKGRPAGFLTKDGNLTATQRQNLIKEWKELHDTVHNAFNVGVLSGGLSWQGIGYTNDDAQFLQSREFQVLEIARWLRIPPHMLAELSKATNSNIEQLMLEFIIFTLLPWVTRWEEELNLKMFTPKEQAMGFVACFDMDAFLRGDSKTRAEVEEKDIRNGVRLLDEVRLSKKLSPYPDGLGAEPLIIASQLDYLRNVKEGKSKLQGGGPDAAAPAKKAAT